MKVIVLAAGFATRLYPLTRDRAKPLLEVAGRPVLSWIGDRIAEIPGVREILVVTNARFCADFETWAAAASDSVPIRVISDGRHSADDRLGALADLALAWDALGPEVEPVLVIAGDNLIDFDLRPYAALFAQAAQPLVLVRHVPRPVPPRRYSEVAVGADGIVTSFREKPDDPRTALSALCIYFLPASIRARLREYLDSGGIRDAPGHFLAWLAPRTAIRAAETAGPWYDIGSLETLERASLAFRDHEPGFMNGPG